MAYIALHYVIRVGKEHITKKVEFYTKKELFRYMWDLPDQELPCKYINDRRKEDRRKK